MKQGAKKTSPPGGMVSQTTLEISNGIRIVHEEEILVGKVGAGVGDVLRGTTIGRIVRQRIKRNVFADEADGSITHQEVRTADVQTADAVTHTPVIGAEAIVRGNRGFEVDLRTSQEFRSGVSIV